MTRFSRTDLRPAGDRKDDRRIIVKPIFCHPDAWTGGFFKLAIELGARSDDRLREAMCKVWAHPSLHGCCLKHDEEPEAQESIDPIDVDLRQPAHGIAEIPRIGRTCCLTTVIRLENGPDWLTLGVPMGSLSRVVPVGAYPFEGGTDLSWRRLMYHWLRYLAESVFESMSFQLGLIGHEVTGDACAEELRRAGIPDERWFGHLWRVGERIERHAPTERAPFSF